MPPLIFASLLFPLFCSFIVCFSRLPPFPYFWNYLYYLTLPFFFKYVLCVLLFQIFIFVLYSPSLFFKVVFSSSSHMLHSLPSSIIVLYFLIPLPSPDILLAFYLRLSSVSLYPFTATSTLSFPSRPFTLSLSLSRHLSSPYLLCSLPSPASPSTSPPSDLSFFHPHSSFSFYLFHLPSQSP